MVPIIYIILRVIEFKTILNKFTIELMNDPDTRDLRLCFERMYGNKATLWAYCYRKRLSK